ncbi:hypothetical protein LAG90_03485 [Marinilongibacter aquaticus]|uniref:hypothetical protein n=1 Tax=Marinilongibacter aquaticus TaxID=2975157 RepID=UPI0021BDA43D|nr:hypothetical protein [Marinilongibacter aquaticus]UBM59711.1 hypothetical protein LAG90_03485 [Marinilongibacter aquaticus]
MRKIGFVLAFFSTIFLACTSSPVEADGGLKVVSGSSFGFCLGYCMQEMRLTDASQNIEMEFFNVRDAKSKSYTDQLNKDDWEEILAEVDLDTFFKLNSVYGCPDCADGGAEYIEISSGVKNHRVTFEYGHEVEGIEKLITLLREQRLAFAEKHLPQ